MTYFGYMILSQLDHFPTHMGGSGSLSNLFEAGYYPGTFINWKPAYFDLYYFTALAYCLTDMVWLVFIYELQNDFAMMVLHHFCTISLLAFSYLTDYSNIGSIVLIVHDVGDIFVYITRIVINTDSKPIIKISTATLLVLVFIYTRIYLYADLIVSFVQGLTWGNQWPDKVITLFLCCLYMMHINWVYLISKRIYKGIIGDKIEDTALVKDVSEKNN